MEPNEPGRPERERVSPVNPVVVRMLEAYEVSGDAARTALQAGIGEIQRLEAELAKPRSCELIAVYVPPLHPVRWRHRKRGTTYVEIGRAIAQSALFEGETAVVYRGDVDRQLHVRLAKEFEDGRFERVVEKAASRKPGDPIPDPLIWREED